jgi:hypothetical protein
MYAAYADDEMMSSGAAYLSLKTSFRGPGAVIVLTESQM